MIRISGDRAVELASKVFLPKNGKKLSEIEGGRALYGEIIEKDAEGREVMIDDGVAVVYRAPYSFTGEDTVEICCHGGVLVTESVLAACLAAGCRAAEAGEFTRRAFVSGKLSLTQAEDLGALLEAKTRGQMLLSRGGLNGHLTYEIKKIYENLRSVLASVYAKIDFPDEDLSSLGEEEMLSRIDEARKRLISLEKTYKAGRAVREGVKTVICGRTNAGKSSIYNRILGRDAAIVTNIEGTTRDVLETTASLGKVTLLLCDTAGLRDTDDKVESIGIERSREAMASAELILAVFDASAPLRADDNELLRSLSGREDVIAVLNKCDMPVCEETQERIKTSLLEYVSVSAETGEGFDELTDAVEKLFECGSLDLSGEAVISGARQHAAVLRAAELLSSACEGLSMGLTVDICGSDIENAMSALGEIEGREVTEDIVSDIFSHFCVGK